MALGVSAGEALVKGVAAISAAILAVLARLRRRREAAIREWLLRAGASQDDIDLALAEEARREVVYRKLAEQRVELGIKLASRTADPSARAAAIEQVMRRERLIAEQRASTSGERVLASAEMAELKRISPQGAYWTLGLRRTHTVDCVAMANHFWPWEVLDIVHPLLHPGCGCELHSLGWALSKGLMTGADIPTVAHALSLARGVILHVEAEKADAEKRYGHLAEARGSQSVSGYVTRSGKRVGGYRRLVDLLDAHPNVETVVEEPKRGLIVGMIRTKGENRGKGHASAFLRDLLAFADAHGKTIGLTPEQMERGGLSKTALTKWYREHGFVPNQGRNKDFAFTESMVRQPKSQEALVDPIEAEALEEIETRWALVEAGVLDPAFAAAAPLAVDPDGEG